MHSFRLLSLLTLGLSLTATAADAQTRLHWGETKHHPSHSTTRTLAARQTTTTVRRPGHQTHYSWDEMANAWSPNVLRLSYTYNGQALQTSTVVTDSATTTPLSRIQSTYSAQNQPLEEITQSWNGTAWVNNSRDVSLYDARGQYAGNEQYQWRNGAWQQSSGYREVHAYNAAGQRTETVYEDYNSTRRAYERNGREVYTLNAAGEWTAVQGQDWDNGAYVDSYRVRNITWYSFADFKPASYFYQEWDDVTNTWDVESRTTTTYQPNGSLVSVRELTTAPNTYVNFERYSTTYDNYGNELQSQDELWQNGQWVLEYASRHTLAYDANNSLLRDLEQVYDNGVYVNRVRDTFGNYQAITLAARTTAVTVPAQVYPNPATGAAWLELSTLRAPGTLRGQLLNSLGQTVRALALTPASGTQRYALDLRGLAPGVYTVRLQANEGSVVQRVVKE